MLVVGRLLSDAADSRTRRPPEDLAMTARALKRVINRIAPACLTTLMFGLVVTFATVGVIGV